METPGALLREKREKSNKSLEEIASVTKIRKSILQAIEEDRYDLLPPPSYVRGFLKLYAREVEFDPDEILRQYGKALKSIKAKESPKKEQREFQPLIPRRYIIVASLLVCAGLVYLLFAKSSSTKPAIPVADKPAPNAIQDPSATSARGEIAATSDAKDLPDYRILEDETAVPSVDAEDQSSRYPITPPLEEDFTDQDVVSPTESLKKGDETAMVSSRAEERPAQHEEFTVRFEARELTWIQLQIGDNEPFDIMLKAGETYSKSASETLKVKIGNAGGIALFFNDSVLVDAGEAGQVVNLKFPQAAEKLKTSE